MNNKILIMSLLLGVAMLAGCTAADQESTSGVGAATATVDVGSDGLTTEQRNIRERLQRDNDPGSIKHLYIISALSGDVLFYSTVDGKVTSSGKRLAPYSAVDLDGDGARVSALSNGRDMYTTEVLQDDGTYGSSIEYLYWFDVAGVYHQIYPSAGALIHVADQPISTLKARVILG